MTTISLIQFHPMMIWQQIKRMGPLGLIILVHVAFLYALQSGLLRQAAQAALPKEIYASFLAPDNPPEPERPKPQPKTVPIVRKAVTAPHFVVPVVNTTPSDQAITAPPPAPAPIATAEPVVAAAPTPVVAAVPPAQIKTISSGVEYIQPPQPVYPSASKRMGEEGRVILRVLINEKGRPERADIQKSSGSPRLDDVAKQAVLQALFKPHAEGGKTLAVYAIVPITFQLNN